MQQRLFTCCICDTPIPYHYFGTLPPYSGVMYSSPTYVLLDPEKRDAQVNRLLEHTNDPKKTETLNYVTYVTMGGQCALCERDVCTNCSIYYCARFCSACAHKHKEEFPSELKVK